MMYKTIKGWGVGAQISDAGRSRAVGLEPACVLRLLGRQLLVEVGLVRAHQWKPQGSALAEYSGEPSGSRVGRLPSEIVPAIAHVSGAPVTCSGSFTPLLFANIAEYFCPN